MAPVVWNKGKLPQCPFYLRHERNTISCEGLAFRTTIKTTYENQKKREKVMGDFCCEQYKKCPLYRAIYEKYGDTPRE